MNTISTSKGHQYKIRIRGKEVDFSKLSKRQREAVRKRVAKIMERPGSKATRLTSKSMNVLKPGEVGFDGNRAVDERDRLNLASLKDVLTPIKSTPGFGAAAIRAKNNLRYKGATHARKLGYHALFHPLFPLISFIKFIGRAIKKTFFIGKDRKKLLIQRNMHLHTIHSKSAPKVGETARADLVPINNSADSFEMKKALVRSATKSIEWSFNFAGGAPFREALDIIDERLQNGVKAHLMVSEDLLEAEDREKLKALKKRHPEHLHYQITERQYIRSSFFRSEENHVKLLVVDGRYFGLGGTGVNKSMTREKLPEEERNKPRTLKESIVDRTFRDSDLFGRGREDNIATTMRIQFFELYNIWLKRMGKTPKEDEGQYTPVRSNVTCPAFDSHKDRFENRPMKFLVTGPEHRGHNPIEQEIVNLVKGANQKVNIANLLFNPSKDVAEALKAKKAQNIPIHGVFNGPTSPAHQMLYTWPARPQYCKLLDVAHEYNVPDQLYHKKVLTVDGQKTLIGSFNLGVKSALCDYEVAAVIDDDGVTKKVDEAIERDKEASNIYKGNDLTHKAGAAVKAFMGSFFG